MSLDKLDKFLETSSDLGKQVKELIHKGYIVDIKGEDSLLIVKVDGKNQKVTPGDILATRAAMQKEAEKIYPNAVMHMFVSAGGNGLVYSMGVAPTMQSASGIARKGM